MRDIRSATPSSEIFLPGDQAPGMPNNRSALAEPRANKWQTCDPNTLNPLGQRLLRLLLAHPSKSPRGFAEDALGKESGGNLSTQLERLTADDPEATLTGNQLVAYARYARVSLFWLVTGEGLPTEGPFGELTAEEMHRYPEGLQRAARALMELDGVDLKLAQWAADDTLARYGGTELLTPQRWLDRLRVAVEDSKGKSGLRPSARLKLK